MDQSGAGPGALQALAGENGDAGATLLDTAGYGAPVSTPSHAVLPGDMGIQAFLSPKVRQMPVWPFPSPAPAWLGQGVTNALFESPGWWRLVQG